MTFPFPPGTPVFNMDKYLDALGRGPFNELAVLHREYKMKADHARAQMRRIAVQLLRQGVHEWPTPLPEDVYALVTTREALIAETLIDACLAMEDIKNRGTPTKLRFIIEPKDGGMIDEAMLEVASRYTQTIPTPDVMAELREEMSQLDRPANIWTPDYEILITYEDELEEA